MNETMTVTITTKEYTELLMAKVRLEFLADYAADEQYSISPSRILAIIGREVTEE